MFHRPKRMTIPFAFCLFVISQACHAQEFRIYTRVFDELAPKQNGKEVVISRSLTIFHAGKVYDKILGTGEIAIFEPSRQRFVLLNTDRGIATTVPLDVIKRKLKIAYQQTEKHSRNQLQNRSEVARHVGRMLKFQLKPDFEEEYNFKNNVLTLSGPSFTYRVKCHALNSKRLAKSYRDYADWIRRLNYILESGLVLPEPRLKLNESLYQRNMIPVEVSLKADVGRRVELRATHIIHWSLDKSDRNMISNWEALLIGKELRVVSLQAYQREVIAANRK